MMIPARVTSSLIIYSTSNMPEIVVDNYSDTGGWFSIKIGNLLDISVFNHPEFKQVLIDALVESMKTEEPVSVS